MTTRTREIHLASRPVGKPTLDNFRTVEVDLPDLDDGQILVRNTIMSVDPYMRGRMNDVESYVPPFQIDQPLDGAAVGEVIESRVEQLPVGTKVTHGLGWREHAILAGDAVRPLTAQGVPDSAYLGVLGMPGLTGYAGLLLAGEMHQGDAVFVSAAAGAVGSAGTPEKIARLKELGFDAAFNYHDGDVTGQLKKAAPEGIDVYFDNVGGDHLEAAIANMRTDGRVAMCGAISQYNSTEPTPAPHNLALAIGKRLTLRGFVIAKYAEQARADFEKDMAGWIADGSVQWDETAREGLDAAAQAFIDLLDGANTGKMIVNV